MAHRPEAEKNSEQNSTRFLKRHTGLLTDRRNAFQSLRKSDFRYLGKPKSVKTERHPFQAGKNFYQWRKKKKRNKTCHPKTGRFNTGKTKGTPTMVM